MRKLYSLVLFLFGAGGTMAQEVSSLLDPVTVTATLSPTRLSNTGRNIVIIPGSMFNKLAVNSLDELLRFVPGIEVQARGPMGVQSDIVIRGGTFQQVLVILDGIKLNDPLTGHFSSYIPVSPDEIDHIEVLKGASSAIYGTEAVGGVIHIITKSFNRNTKKNTFGAKISTGQFGLFNGQLGGTYADSNQVVSGGILTNHSNGQPQRGSKGFFDLTTASVSYALKLNKSWNLAIRTAYDYRSFSAQNFYTSFASDTAVETVKSWWNHIRVSYQSNRIKWSTHAGYKAVNDDYKFNSSLSANKNNSHVFQFLSMAELAFNPKTTLTTGIQFIKKAIASNDRGNHEVFQNGIFIILHQKIGENLIIDPAVRLEYNALGGSELVPQINASYRWNQVSLRGSIGRTLRDADFTERYNNYGRSMLSSGSIGNPDLEAETSSSWELGVGYRIGSALKLSGGYFKRKQNNLIDFVTTSYADMPRKENLMPGGTYALAKNISSVATAGLESDLQYVKQLKPDQQITGNLGLLWLNSKLPNGSTPGFYISSHARFMTNFNIAYQVNWLTVGINGMYKKRDARKAASPVILAVSPEYFIVNAKIEAKLKRGWSCFTQLDNIGNVKYSDLLGSVMPQRWLMGGVKWGLY